MERNIFRKIIVEGQELAGSIELVERPFVFEANGNYVFVGVRQAGKSYLLYQRIRELRKAGHSIEEMVYVNFDDERIKSVQAEELDLILQSYASLLEQKPILFLDEIQNIDGWENFARRLANQKYRVYITGSNAKMLSRDIATTLGGRFFCQNVYPYSFAEYLSAVGVRLSAQWQYGKQAAQVAKAFNTYFYFGGFPELPQITAKRLWLNEIYNKIFFSDIVVRNKIRNEEALRLLVKRMAETVKQPVSYNRFANLIKSVGVQVSTSSIIDFVRYLKEACLVFSLENYAAKFVEKESNKKYYFVDNGLLNIFLLDPETTLLENLCALHLHKKYGENLYFYNQNIEVDFFLPDEKIGIQACYSMQDDTTANREIQALLKLNNLHRLDKMLIITRDEERTISIEGQQIEVIPIWKWLLE
jgi:predicted AAA+ superfamily ATPase